MKERARTLNHWFVRDPPTGKDVPSRLAAAMLVARELPKEKRFITGWKKCRRGKTGDAFCKYVIVELRIPLTAHMRCPMDDKCRASSARVVAVHTIGTKSTADGSIDYELKRSKLKTAWSGWDPGFKYDIGEVVRPKKPFSRSNSECESGIHFFLTQEEAISYIL